jgi:hypothetical protein
MVNNISSRKLNIERDEFTEKQGETRCSGMVSSSCSTICTRSKSVTAINVYSLLDSDHSIYMLSIGWQPHYMYTVDMYTKLYLHCRKGYLDENTFSQTRILHVVIYCSIFKLKTKLYGRVILW